ncbi:hypothetical protein C1H46_029993 [Malus baccata]|uniref:Uncharacterized protein n=1 Tax=Malus baccata TaxID=106549 RepID=A0A540LDV5_MALBA|nr:hypothetical protein C1H46_029993 [Malus baccata]
MKRWIRWAHSLGFGEIDSLREEATLTPYLFANDRKVTSRVPYEPTTKAYLDTMGHTKTYNLG